MSWCWCIEVPTVDDINVQDVDKPYFLEEIPIFVFSWNKSFCLCKCQFNYIRVGQYIGPFRREISLALVLVQDIGREISLVLVLVQDTEGKYRWCWCWCKILKGNIVGVGVGAGY
jgi:hypothetical protein